MTKISRREALRNCLIISVGAALIPSCMQDKDKPVIALKHIELDGNQQKLVSELCETIIPATDTPGAKDTYTHLFVLKMVDDELTKDEQQKFAKGLKDFDQLAKKKFDKSFVECTPQQRDELVTGIVNDKNSPEDLTGFFSTVKKLTVQGYMTSKYYLSNVRIYKLVPGQFHGCVPVASINQKGPLI